MRLLSTDWRTTLLSWTGEHTKEAKTGDSSAKKAVVATLGVVIVVIIVLAALQYLVPMLTSPRPIVTFSNVYDTFEGLDYIAVVETRVRNDGSDGWIIVYADFSAGGQYEQKSHRLYLRKGETKYTWFKFDLDFWRSLFGGLIDPETLKMAYRVWAEPA